MVFAARAAGISFSTASMTPQRMPMSRMPRSFWLGSSTSPPLITRSNLSPGPIAACTARASAPEPASATAPARNFLLDLVCIGGLPFGVRLAYHPPVALRLLVSICGLAALLLCAAATAQPFPSKPIRLLTGYPPGGSADFLSRIAADELSRDLGVAVVVENRP